MVTSQNLPYQPTSFVGRAHELYEIRALLSDPACRLLTLVGSGGIGKTRLATEVVSNLPCFTDGIVFVPLQPINAVENILSALASALKVSLQGGDPLQQLLHFLSDKQLLLLLDNFEHLLEGVELVLNILQAAPQVKLLVTSRVTLNLREEWVRTLSGLDYPAGERPNPLEDFDAIQLFVQRVRQVRANFSLADEQESVLLICRLVQGMPLALELAAARTKTLPCALVADEIQRSMDFLAVHLHDLPERHRSIEAVFDWSWELLNESEQLALMKLSVFAGGFTPETAQLVTGATLDMLTSLTEKSLIAVDTSGRYQFHDLLHRFASSKLDTMPELREQIANAHSAYFAVFLAEREAGLNGPTIKRSLTEIIGEIANVRTAWKWAVDHARIEALEQARVPLFTFYAVLDWDQEAGSMFQAAAAALRSGKRGRREDSLLGHLMMDSGAISRFESQFELATTYLQESLTTFQRLGDIHSTIVVFDNLANVFRDHGDFRQAHLYAQESLTLAIKADDDRLIAECKYTLAIIISALGKYQEAGRLLEDAQETFRQHGARSQLGNVIRNLGDNLYIRGVYEQAERLLKEALIIAEDHNSRADVSHALELLGQVAYAVGDFDAAQRYFEKGLRIAREIPNTRKVGWCLLHGGYLACTIGDYATARASFQEVLTLAAGEGEQWKQARAIAGIGLLAYLQGKLPEAERYLNDSLSRSREIGFRLGEAKILNTLGHVAIAKGDVWQASQAFAETLKIGQEIEIPSTILESLVGLAELNTDQGNLPYALELLHLCLRHPALHADARNQAQNFLSKIQAKSHSPEAVPDWKSDSLPDLMTIASNLLAQLTSEENRLPSQRNDLLTERERDVLYLLMQRRTNQEIAEALFISIGTVKTHVHRICGKLQVASRRHIAARAQELGLA